MEHIEIAGPPAAGKSTLVKQLDRKDAITGNDITLRLSARSVGLEAIYSILPQHVRTNVFRQTWIRGLRESHFTEFANRYPDIISLAGDILHQQPDDTTGMWRWLIENSASYELAKRQAEGNETVIFDEGLSNFLIGVIMNGGENVPSAEWAQSIPVPDILYIVLAEPETIQERQKSRDGVSNSKKIIKTQLKIIDAIADILKNRGTEIRRITNDRSCHNVL